MAEARTQPIKLRAICCVCKVVYRDGTTVDGRSSHGYCPKHEAEVLAQLKQELEDHHGKGKNDIG